LGSLALGDIGQWFPDSSSENLGRASSDFVRAVHAHMKGMGWKIVHCDFNIFLEEPKLGAHKENIRREIASLLGIELSSVSVKAKTMEGLGAIGERKAVAAQAVVTVCQSKSPTV
jgi:2-C-methyl-D-erythritol 2,4-cyclodiphosphate synthase